MDTQEQKGREINRTQRVDYDKLLSWVGHATTAVIDDDGKAFHEALHSIEFWAREMIDRIEIAQEMAERSAKKAVAA